jgi:hypothetical protein
VSGQGVAVALAIALVAGCASSERRPATESADLSTRVVRPVKYRLAGADPLLRRNLEQAERELEARNYRVAVTHLDRALWQLEAIDDRALRLGELANVYTLLAHAHSGLGSADLADEQRRTARALTDAVIRDEAANPAGKLARAKKAYLTAQFADAVRMFRDVLVETEDVPFVEVRLIHLVEARCYLAFSYFAAREQSRVRDELSRVWAQDPSMRVCLREAPPSVRPLIFQIQRRTDS